MKTLLSMRLMLVLTISIACFACNKSTKSIAISGGTELNFLPRTGTGALPFSIQYEKGQTVQVSAISVPAKMQARIFPDTGSEAFQTFISFEPVGSGPAPGTYTASIRFEAGQVSAERRITITVLENAIRIECDSSHSIESPAGMAVVVSHSGGAFDSTRLTLVSAPPQMTVKIDDPTSGYCYLTFTEREELPAGAYPVRIKAQTTNFETEKIITLLVPEWSGYSVNGKRYRARMLRNPTLVHLSQPAYPSGSPDIRVDKLGAWPTADGRYEYGVGSQPSLDNVRITYSDPQNSGRTFSTGSTAAAEKLVLEIKNGKRSVSVTEVSLYNAQLGSRTLTILAEE